MEGEEMSDKHLTIYQAIHQHCIECAGGIRQVKPCTNTECRLYPFRFGTNPYCKKPMQERDVETGKFIKIKNKTMRTRISGDKEIQIIITDAKKRTK